MFQGGDRRRKLGPIWARLGGLLRRLMDLFPWTPLGVCVGGFAYWALHTLAFGRLDLVWLVVGYVAVGLCVLAPAFVVGTAVGLRLHKPDSETDPLLLETGISRESGFRLPSLRLLPFVQLRWGWLDPPALVEPDRRGGQLLERITARDRGRHLGVKRRLVVEDPFGLSRVAVRLSDSRAVDVLPRLDGLQNVAALTALGSGDALPHPLGLDEGDRLELRRYVPGDPARFIHWKVFGRTRKLMVRMPERALAVASRTAAFLIAGEDDDASAALARLAVERRLLGVEWTFGTDLSVNGTERVDEALDMIMSSSRARDRGAQGLSAFLELVDRRGPASLVIFAPPRPGPWIGRVAEVAQRRQVRVMIGTDGVDSGDRPALWRRLLMFNQAPSGTPHLALEEVVRRLAESGCRASVVDRRSGRALSERHRQAMVDLAALPDMSAGPGHTSPSAWFDGGGPSAGAGSGP